MVAGTIPTMLLILLAASKEGTWRKALRHVLIYSFDMTAVYVGFTLGFGLEVKNWWWVFTPMILCRCVWHIYHHAIYLREARERL